MAQTKPKAGQFYGVSGNGTAGQVLISDGNGGMSWGANTEQFTVSWATPTGQSLTYTQPNPQSSTDAPGSLFPSTTFTATKSGEEISGTATIAGLPTGITATQSLSGSGVDNVLTVTLAGVFPSVDSLNTNLTISGLTISVPLVVNYLVVAGGGGGAGGYQSAGGGAGGYRNSYASETSGGGGSSESSLSLSIATNYSVTVGAAGAAGIPINSSQGSANKGGNGSNSVFDTITSIGGGGGASYWNTPINNNIGNSGGSGGGAGPYSGSTGANTRASGTANQGYAGGGAAGYGEPYMGAGGGGAGGVGSDGSGSGLVGNGGVGLSSSITGTATFRGGGGGGAGWSPSYSPGAGGNGGGGAGGSVPSASSNPGPYPIDGATNTGGGGGGQSQTSTAGAAGGSGVVILRYPSAYTISGLSGTTTTVGTDKVTTFTGGTGNIQFN